MQTDPTVNFENPVDANRATPSETISVNTGSATLVPSIPGYEMLEELGRGGMGVVYKARHLGLNRIVALKMILGQPFDGQMVRFRAEAESLARLQHPNIVQVFDVGEHQGHPYLTLEYCSGGSLDEQLQDHSLPPKEAAEMVATLAEAMQAAHEAGIIHRDLKPANVLLSDEWRVASDASAVPSPLTTRHTPLATPKITDFGLAKKLDDVGRTQPGDILGTPSYMAPEQASGKAHEVGPLVDVYALGAILYECLTGHPPFQAATVMETLLLVRYEEPLFPHQFVPSLPRDLDTICLKCLCKEPSRRYAHAGALAADLRRFLAGEPILARPVGRVQRILKWARRKPAIAALSTAILFVTLLGVAAFAWAFGEALKQRDAERIQRGVADTKRNEAEQAKEEALRQKENAEHTLALNNIQLAQAIWQEPNALAARLKLEDIPDHKRGWEWRYLRRAFDGSLYTIHQHRLPVQVVAFHPDGRLLASAGNDGRIVITDIHTGHISHTMSLETASGHRFRDLAFSPDGEELIVAHTGTIRGEVVHVWDYRTGKHLRALKAPGEQAQCVALSPDGKLIAAGQVDSSAQGHNPVDLWIWDRATGQLVHSLKGHYKRVAQVAFSPDSRRIVSVGGDHLVRMWDLQTGKLAFSCIGDRTEMQTVAFSPDGRLLASGAVDGSVRLWSATNGKVFATLTGLRERVQSVAFSPDGQTLAAAGSDNIIALWDAARHHLIRKLIGHHVWIERVTFSPDGHLMASGGGDFTVKVWDTRTPWPALQLARSPVAVEAAAVAPDNRLVAIADKRGVQLWDSFTGQPLRMIAASGSQWRGLKFHRKGRRLAGTSVTSGLSVWDVETGATLWEINLPNRRFSAPRFAGPAGDNLLAITWDESEAAVAHLWNGETGKLLKSLPLPEGFGCDPAVSPEGTWAALPTDKGTIRLWNLDTGEERTALSGPAGAITAVNFSPDGRMLAAGVQGGAVVIWKIASGEKLLQFSAHPEGIFVLDFSPDSRRLVTRGRDQTINIWDARTGQRLLGLPLEAMGMRDVLFSDDGSRLYVVDRNRVIVWDSEDPSERITLRGHSAKINSVTYSPNGKYVLTGSEDGTVRLWDADKGTCRHTIACGQEPSTVHFHKNGDSFMASFLQGPNRAWKADTGHEFEPERNSPFTVSSRFSPSGKHIVVTDGPLAYILPNGPADEREQGRRRQLTAIDPAWHFSEAMRFETAGLSFAAAYHVERLLKGDPWNSALWHRHSRAAFRAGMNDKATLSYLRGVLLER